MCEGEGQVDVLNYFLYVLTFRGNVFKERSYA